MWKNIYALDAVYLSSSGLAPIFVIIALSFRAWTLWAFAAFQTASSTLFRNRSAKPDEPENHPIHFFFGFFLEAV